MCYLKFLKSLVLVIGVYQNELWGFENFYFFLDVLIVYLFQLYFDFD